MFKSSMNPSQICSIELNHFAYVFNGIKKAESMIFMIAPLDIILNFWLVVLLIPIKDAVLLRLCGYDSVPSLQSPGSSPFNVSSVYKWKKDISGMEGWVTSHENN